MSANEMFPARAENIKITISSRLSHLCVQPFLQPDRQFETLSSKSTCCNNRKSQLGSCLALHCFLIYKNENKYFDHSRQTRPNQILKIMKFGQLLDFSFGESPNSTDMLSKYKYKRQSKEICFLLFDNLILISKYLNSDLFPKINSNQGLHREAVI